MKSSKITFTNHNGATLSGRMDLPLEQDPHNFAIFAHCFTCTKDFSAVRNVSKALASQGFGVLRFDFTGLGDSEGDFADTNFSSNVDDLVSAATFLAKEYKAPSLLVGHSLGGAAAIFAASEIESIQALATIGAPSNPIHVKKQFGEKAETIVEDGQATVSLAGRDFTFKKQFLDDLEKQSCEQAAAKLDGKALLIMHSPQDATVSIKNAEEIYHAAKHPKSFVTLDGSEHLLIDKKNAAYVGKVVAGWAARYIDIPLQEEIKSSHQVVASLDDEDTFTTLLKLGNHYSKADEPVRLGGDDYGPTPYELVSGGLASCTAMTLQMYARRKGWKIRNVEVHVSYGKKHAIDCDDCENENAKIDTFTREIKLIGDLNEKQVKRLLQIADKCPVHKTLHSETQIITSIIE
ncbi:bifunctional alpha/beta hydrolase/OsmC family protein [Marinirhabdus gelatinilytica]|uniref:Putative redox protein n=1 Tax=Marinirhabdus gelatinilytica TaxID=1703343 RepID=A0A370QFG4_9FLAO|nr:bifunctional alpha/beta hydrolase/OsmC family protein [Marinirhabdus gelatinilytica]RDK87108.1 putative redox protein [Marinirhabdus gelatinilytica]